MATIAEGLPIATMVSAEDLSLRRRVAALVFICLAYACYA